MKTSSRSVAALAAAWAVLGPFRSGPAGARQDPQQPPVFRSSATAVLVDVSVRDQSRRVLTDLTAADFLVQDNGVPQQVDEVSYGRLPIDVTVGLDVSRSVDGPMLDSLRVGVAQLMRDLRRDDRLKLMLFNMRFTRTIDFTTDVAEIERAIRAATAAGGTALFDALSVAMVTASAPDRRQLIVFFSDGNDTSSTTMPSTLIKVAERSRATVSFVLSPVVSSQSGATKNPAPSTALTNLSPALLPGSGSQRIVVADPAIYQIAADTGGIVLPLSAGMGVGTTFLQVLDRFRSAYVLFYIPRGVDRGGFHTIGVTVNRPGAVVVARRGYFGG